MFRAVRTPALLGALLVSCTASIPDDEAGEVTALAVDSTDAEWLPAGLGAIVFSSIGAETDPARAAESVDRIRAVLRPADCVGPRIPVTDATIPTSRYHLTKCEAENLDAISGDFDFGFETTPSGALSLHLHSAELVSTVATEEVTFTLTREATIGTTRLLKWDGSVKGTTAAGRAIDRQIDITAKTTVTESCPELNGSSIGKMGARDLFVEVKDVERCKQACPRKGRLVITLSNPNAGYQLTYDEDGVGLLEGGDRERDVNLPCERR